MAKTRRKHQHIDKYEIIHNDNYDSHCDSGACHHLFTDGAQCLGSAVRGSAYCRWHVHAALRQQRRDGYRGRHRVHSIPGLELPTIEDPASLQVAVHEVLDAIIDGRVRDRRAGWLLYGLQIAQANLPGKLILPAKRDTVFDELKRRREQEARAKRAARRTEANTKKPPQSAPLPLADRHGERRREAPRSNPPFVSLDKQPGVPSSVASAHPLAFHNTES